MFVAEVFTLSCAIDEIVDYALQIYDYCLQRVNWRASLNCGHFIYMCLHQIFKSFETSERLKKRTSKEGSLQ